MENFKLVMQLLKKENGATSIFVMILMVVLIVFGLAALTTSLASLKLSGKNTSWTKEYYALEGEAETYLALIDQQLSESEDKARKATNGNRALYASTYYENVWENLKILSDTKPEIEVSVEQRRVGFTVKENKEAYPKNITVVLDILVPDYDETQTKGQARYFVVQWKEWQKSFEYDQDIDFENPSFDNPNFEDSGVEQDSIEDTIDEAPFAEEDIQQDEEKSFSGEEDQRLGRYCIDVCIAFP